jgi:DNA-binding response OmpR family regulator
MAFSLETIPSQDRRTRFLVVENDVTSVFALRQFFAAAGHDVDCAAGPIEGLRLLDRNSYEAIITDLHLAPGGLGEGMLIAAQARLRNPRACVVMLTANSSPLTEQEARECGVDVYHTKPVDLALLTTDIERVLRTQAIDREHVGNATMGPPRGEG